MNLPQQPASRHRFRRVYVPVDGSAHSDQAAGVAIDIAGAVRGSVVASHAYAAQLHDNRFRQMEGGLPAQFRKEDELKRQRKVHDTLITRGLELISDSYLDAVERGAEGTGIELERRSVEGRNWRVLLEDIGKAEADLVVLGAVGLGAVDGARVGTVCERVVRRLATDALVVRRLDRKPFERIAVAVDGSARSLGALVSALELAKLHPGQLELVSSFDPHFHHTVFRAVSGVLSAEAGKVFKFDAQQQLHEEVIDEGLAKIYRGHLELAARVAAEAGFPAVPTTLLSGKAHLCLERFVAEKGITTLFLGRTGIHSNEDLDLGSCPENLLRGAAACNLFLGARAESADRWVRHEAPLTWTEDALKRMERVPDFVRAMATGAVERRARRTGHTVVTSDLIDEATAALHGHGNGNGKAPRPEVTVEDVEAKYASWKQGSQGKQLSLPWEPDALERLGRVPDFVRGQVGHEIEQQARARGLERVTVQLMAEFKEKMARDGVFHTS